MARKRLVLDEDFTYALIYRAYSDGYARPYSQKTLQSPYSRRVLSIGSDTELQQKLLPSLLLYESIEIEPFDNFVLYSSNRKSIYPKEEVKEGTVMVGNSVPRLISSDEVKKYLDVVPPEMIVDLLHSYLLRRARVNIDKSSLIKILREDIPKYYDELRPRYFKLTSRLLEPELAPLLSELFGTTYTAKPLDEATKNKLSRKLKEVKELLDTYSLIASAYTYIARKLTYCESMNAHLLSTFLPANPVDLRRSDVRQLASDRSDEWSALVGVVFTNMPWIRPRTYDEFLKLSKNKNVQDFRDYFHDSLEDIREGRTTLEKVAEKIRSAARALKRVRFAKRLNYVMTFWALIPIDILSSLPPVARCAISLATVSPQLYSYIERRRYRWALIDVALRRL